MVTDFVRTARNAFVNGAVAVVILRVALLFVEFVAEPVAVNVALAFIDGCVAIIINAIALFYVEFVAEPVAVNIALTFIDG